MANPHTSSAERFPAHYWSFVEKTDGCWNWKGAPCGGGYGRLRTPNGRKMAHHVSYEMAYGPIPDGQWVLHKCDNRACVRPDHLFLGTHTDNMNDMMNKGRHYFQKNPDAASQHMAKLRILMKENNHRLGKPGIVTFRGEDTPTAKLSDEVVREIRRAYIAGEGGYRKLAPRFGVSRAQIQRIIRGKAWAHIL